MPKNNQITFFIKPWLYFHLIKFLSVFVEFFTIRQGCLSLAGNLRWASPSPGIIRLLPNCRKHIFIWSLHKPIQLLFRIHFSRFESSGTRNVEVLTAKESGRGGGGKETRIRGRRQQRICEKRKSWRWGEVTGSSNGWGRRDNSSLVNK